MGLDEKGEIIWDWSGPRKALDLQILGYNRNCIDSKKKKGSFPICIAAKSPLTTHNRVKSRNPARRIGTSKRCTTNFSSIIYGPMELRSSRDFLCTADHERPGTSSFVLAASKWFNYDVFTEWKGIMQSWTSRRRQSESRSVLAKKVEKKKEKAANILLTKACSWPLQCGLSSLPRVLRQ